MSDHRDAPPRMYVRQEEDGGWTQSMPMPHVSVVYVRGDLHHDRVESLERQLADFYKAARDMYRLANNFEIVGEGRHQGPIYFSGPVYGEESDDDRERFEALERMGRALAHYEGVDY